MYVCMYEVVEPHGLIRSRCPDITPAREDFVFETTCYFSRLTRQGVIRWNNEFRCHFEMFILYVPRKWLKWQCRYRAIFLGELFPHLNNATGKIVWLVVNDLSKNKS